MTDTWFDSRIPVLETRIPALRRVEGLTYGSPVVLSTGRLWHVTLGDDLWGLAWEGADDQLPWPEDGETQDEAIVRCIREEIGPE